MQELTKSEMQKINCGASAVLIGTVVTAIIAFVSGILSGYSNPKKCN